MSDSHGRPSESNSNSKSARAQAPAQVQAPANARPGGAIDIGRGGPRAGPRRRNRASPEPSRGNARGIIAGTINSCSCHIVNVGFPLPGWKALPTLKHCHGYDKRDSRIALLLNNDSILLMCTCRINTPFKGHFMHYGYVKFVNMWSV